MSRKPLADHAAFRTWPKQPREWGPDGSGWRSWFGGGVVDGLCDVLDEHLATRPGRDMSIAAIGCVPWLTSAAVVDRLAALGSCCVVIDKSENAPPPVLRKLSGSGFPNAAITRLEDVMPAVDGAAPLVIGPYTPREATWHEIEAVRVVGWRAGKYKPLPHAKVLVLGQVGWVTYETPYGDQEEFRFIPSKVWWGSANWTELSSMHLETGFLCDDLKLVASATDFVADLIAFSEPLSSQSAGPEPSMIEVPWDNEAMAQASAERDDGYEDLYDDEE